jgi:large subunit ribosomal protein L21
MYAVIETGGKQVRVQVGQVVKVESLAGDIGSPVTFDRVLMVGGDEAAKVGKPNLEGAQVKGSIVEQGRGPKIAIYTFKRRKNSNRKTQGHRQNYTAVKIESIDA